MPSNFVFHDLTGDGKGVWSMIVTRNQRLAFNLNEEGALFEKRMRDQFARLRHLPV